ncbi:MAG: carboxyl-terminal processing protease [Alteromonas naphthalenivorans]|jgi:carboxyl-terminal processing protease
MKKIFLLSTLLCIHSLQANTIIKSTLNEVEQEIVKMSQTFSEVVNLIYYKYYKNLDPKELQKAFVDSFNSFAKRDPHSSVLGPEDMKNLQQKMSGEFSGIGVVLPGDLKDEDDEFLPFIEIVPGGPSDKAGIRAGDKLMQINDEVIKGMKIDQIMNKLKGEKHSKVNLKVMREKYPEPLDFEVKRDIIKDEISLSFYLPDQNIYYLLLSIFSEKSANHVADTLKEAHKKKCKGIIIDLRNNTGGLFDSALEIAGLFLPKNTLVAVTKNREHKVTESWKTSREPLPLAKGMPIFFIVNNYTASAAEIMAGTLKIYSEKEKDLHVFVVGTQTFGKGSVQEVIPLSNDCALRLTTALYYLPFDTCIQGKGVTPDFVIEPRLPLSDTHKWMTDTYGREKALKGSIKPHDDKEEKKEEKKKKKDDKTPWKEQRQEMLANDYMVQNTVSLIDMLNAGTKAHPSMASRQAQKAFLNENYVVDRKLNLQEIKE